MLPSICNSMKVLSGGTCTDICSEVISIVPYIFHSSQTLNLYLYSQLCWIPRKKFIYITKCCLMPRHTFPQPVTFVTNSSMSSFWYHSPFNYWIIYTLPTAFQIVILLFRDKNNFLNIRAQIFIVANFFSHNIIFPLSKLSKKYLSQGVRIYFFRLTTS